MQHADGADRNELHRLQRLLEVGPELTSELELPAVLDQLLDTARELTGARYAAIGVLDARRRTLSEFVTAGIDDETREAIGALPRGHGILGLVIDRPGPILLADVSAHPRSYGFPAGHPPMRGFLGLPITIRGEVWGNIYLTEKAGGADFDDDDVAAIGVLARWAAVAIDNARLFAEKATQRAELRRAVRSLRAANDIAIAVGDDTDLSRNLELMVARGRDLVGAQALVIWLLDRDELKVAATAGTAQVPEGTVIALGESAVGRALNRASPDAGPDTRDLLTDPSRYGLPEDSATLIVPLIHGERGLGVLAAFGEAHVGANFDADAHRALEAFAVSAATSVSISRSVEAQRLRDSLAAAESERRRWARELHDETLQGLAALKLGLALAIKVPAGRGWPLVEAAVAQLSTDIASLRAIIADLRPAALEELGLEPALRSLMERVALTAGLTVTVAIELDGERLAPDVETVAYRVAQEALTNVVKHAQAHHVNVHLARVDRTGLQLTVEDDGIGLTDSRRTAPEVNEGFGLTGMRERAALVHGSLHVSALPNGGTSVTLAIPSS